jgi:hypothetical protein
MASPGSSASTKADPAALAVGAFSLFGWHPIEVNSEVNSEHRTTIVKTILISNLLWNWKKIK